MSDPVTPLNGASFQGFVTVTETAPQGMITLRGDLAAAALRDAVLAVAGADLPDMGRIVINGSRGCAWMSPDEALLLLPRADVPDALAQLATALEGSHHLAVDVSDARAMFRLEGAGLRDVLAKLTPADVSPAGLAPFTLRRSRLAQVAAAFWLTDQQAAHVICFRSVAQYVFDLLSTSARKGSEPELFDS
ncbi:sarcosine oxidase subunit gamma [Oceaniglobus trochenteri]|uniref:sarcosine oxidase subunit gamma n=1 Tax=Oceaniglobus trochenteri TaxID=2763260 RepID=UPI001CFFC98D|nr:sarcosine oxidase subunit gamma family protein [Oceaniglobus trochenteri]